MGSTNMSLLQNIPKKSNSLFYGVILRTMLSVSSFCFVFSDIPSFDLSTFLSKSSIETEGILCQSYF